MANPKIQKPIKKGNNMRNMFTYDFTNRTIVATKATLKKASNPTTDEYTALIKMIEGQPTFRVVEKTIKNSGNKKTYKGLTLKMMMDYLFLICHFLFIHHAYFSNNYEENQRNETPPPARKRTEQAGFSFLFTSTRQCLVDDIILE